MSDPRQEAMEAAGQASGQDDVVAVREDDPPQPPALPRDDE